MTYQSTPYTELTFLSGFVAAVLCAYGIHLYRSRSENRTTLLHFSVLMAATATWGLVDTIQLSLVDLQAKLFWITLATVTTAFIPTAWFTLSLAYTERESYIKPKTLALLAIEPVVVVASALTAHLHDFYYSNPTLVDDPGFWIVTRELGPLFIVHSVYSYVLVIAGSILLVRFVRFDQREYRWQAILLSIGAILPVVTNAAYLFKLGGIQVNLTSIALGISGILFAVAITRYRFLDLEPVARDTVVERMRDGYVVCDDGGRIVDSNPAASDLLGVDGDLVGQRFPTAVPEMEGALAAAAAGEEVRDEFVLGDDDRRFVDVTVTPMESVRGTLVLLRDVTERRRTERRYQTLIEGSSDIITVLDEDGTVEYASPSTERVLGIDADTIVGEPVFDLVHPDDRAGLRETFEEGVRSGRQIDRAEYRVLDAEGEWCVHEAVGRNLLSNPDVEGIVVNSRDITDRKARQRELEATNERLERFASVVSHDLRNPLNVADGYAELLEERIDDPAVGEIRTSHERMGRIIDDVLELAREDELGRRDPASLAAIARDAWANVDTGTATLETTDVRVVADRERLGRALENLFRNSVEHGSTCSRTQSDDNVERSPDGVAVTVGPTDDGFYVADDGPGVPAELEASLFDEGVSGASGTGLGLAIVADIVDAHGWTVEYVHSDDGARFEIAAGSELVLAPETA